MNYTIERQQQPPQIVFTMNSLRSSFNVTFSKRWLCDFTQLFSANECSISKETIQGVEWYTLYNSSLTEAIYDFLKLNNLSKSTPCASNNDQNQSVQNKLWQAKNNKDIPTWWYWLAITRQDIFDKLFILFLFVSVFFCVVEQMRHTWYFTFLITYIISNLLVQLSCFVYLYRWYWYVCDCVLFFSLSI